MSELQQFSEGSVIFITGERSNGRVYKLNKGTCFLEKIWGVKRIVEKVQIGEFIGMHSSLGGKVRQETCVMQTNGLMRVYSRDAFLEVLKSDGELLVRLLREFCKQLEDVYGMFPKKGSSQPIRWTENSSANYLKEVADFYYSQGLYDRALYGYKKYIQNTEIKIGPQIKQVETLIDEIEKKQTTEIFMDSKEATDVEEDEISSPTRGKL